MPELRTKKYTVDVVGDSTLVFGDFRHYLPEIPWHSIDLILTDPPYGIEYETNYREVHEPHAVIENDHDVSILTDNIQCLSGRLKRDGAIYCFCAPMKIDEVLPPFRSSLTVKNVLVWDKTNWGAGDLVSAYGYQYEAIVFAVKNANTSLQLKDRHGDVIRVPRVGWAEAAHPNQKPDKLIRKLIENTTNEGDIVFDPFMGSGRTGVCCARMGRRFIGCEIDPKYYKMSLDSVRHAYAQMGHVSSKNGRLNVLTPTKKASPVVLGEAIDG